MVTNPIISSRKATAIAISTSILLLCNAFLVAFKSHGQETPQNRGTTAETIRLKLYELGQRVSPPEAVGRDPEKDLEILALLPALSKSCEETEKEFVHEIASKVQPYRDLAGTIGYCRERVAGFKQALTEYASIESITRDADSILKMAKQSIEYKAPAYFMPGNDISRHTSTMQIRLKVLESIMPNSPELERGRTIATTTATEVRKIQLQLLDGILQQNELPTDNYTRPDRQELLQLVEKTWLKQSPKEKPVRVGLIGSDWVRTDAWEIQNRTLYKIDRSRLQGFVVCEHDGKTVVIRHVQLHKDHTNKDKTTGWAISDSKADIEPISLVLKSKLK